MFDLLIKNGTILDGSGSPAKAADVAIQGDTIAEVSQLGSVEARETLDATNLLITPGFIDAHSHSDMNLIINPNAESKLRQGVTTEIIGQCGSSAFPLQGPYRIQIQEDMEKYNLEITWTDIEGYCENLQAGSPAVNVALFIGQGAIRGSVLGYENRKPDPDQLKRMQLEVEKAMDCGALGLSTGLIYAPSYFADTVEIAALAQATRKANGLYASHIRGEGDTLLDAIQEAIQIGREAGVGVQVSHLKASAPRNWGKVRQAIELIEQARADSLDVQFDKYPYLASSTSLDSLLPKWAHEGGAEATLSRLADPAMRTKILDAVSVNNEGEKGWDSILLAFSGCEKYQAWEGETLAEIARKIGIDPFDLFIDLLVCSRLATAICSFSMCQEDTDLALMHTCGLVCSDSSAWAPYGVLSHGKPHPRAYGTFPKFFRDYVKERPLLALEDAVAKVTSRCAERFELKKRGRIRPGYFADLVVLDWKRFFDTATYANPHQYPTGVEGVIVNGVVTLWQGSLTGKRAGRILAKSSNAA